LRFPFEHVVAKQLAGGEILPIFGKGELRRSKSSLPFIFALVGLAWLGLLEHQHFKPTVIKLIQL
jgi:hypothetical protein